MISFKEHKTTPAIANIKLTQRRGLIFSLRKTTANKAETTGKLRLMIAALLAVDCCVPMVTNTWAGNWPSKASTTKIFKSLSLLFLFSLMVLYTKGSIKIAESNIGINTVLNAPTWFCTNFIQVNCSDHIRLQANNKVHDTKDFFIQGY